MASQSPFYPLRTRASGVWDEATTGRWLDNVQRRIAADGAGNILDRGAVGDASTTDTNAAQSALNASGVFDITPSNTTGFNVGALTVPTTTKSITGVRFKQAAANANVLNITSSTRLEITNVDITGVGAGATASNNEGINATSCSHLHIRGGVYTGLRHHAVYLSGCTDSSVDIEGYALSSGVRLRGCNGIQVRGELSSPQTANSEFTVAYGLDSDNGHAFGQCKNIDLDVVVKNYINAQSVLLHAGENVTISGVFDNVLCGISAGTFSATDVLNQITINGIVYRGTTTIDGNTGNTNYGILLSGKTALVGENATINGGTFTKTNYVEQSASGAAIVVQYWTGVTINGPVIEDGYSPGIYIGPQTRGLKINGAVIRTMAAVGGQQVGVKIAGASNSWSDCQGTISNLITTGCVDAVRLGNTAAAAATSITSAPGTTATLTKTGHGFLTGDWIRIRGVTFASAADAYYNGAFQVASVPTADTLTYTMRGTPASATAPGSPTIQGSYDGLFINNTIAPDATNLVVSGFGAVVDGCRRHVAGDCFPWVENTTALTDITNSASNPMIGLAGGREGQTVVLQFTDANTSLADAGNFRLNGAFTSAANRTLTLSYNGSVWYEVTRTYDDLTIVGPLTVTNTIFAGDQVDASGSSVLQGRSGWASFGALRSSAAAMIGMGVKPNPAVASSYVSSSASSAGRTAIELSDAAGAIGFLTSATAAIAVDSAVTMVEQVRITHTASANRYITLTGSNGGNPTLSTSAGDLAVTPNVVLGGTLVGPVTASAYNTVSTTVNFAGAASVALNIGNASGTTTVAGPLTVNTAGGNVTWGVYTPTRSAEANLDANVTPSEAQYMRVGNTVTVSGRFTADPTLTATATSFELTLPVSSNIGAVEDAAGVAFCGTIAGMGAAITGSVANNTAVFTWVASDVTSQSWSYTYSYQVI